MKRWLSFILVFALTFQQITPSLATNNVQDFDPNNNNVSHSLPSPSSDSKQLFAKELAAFKDLRTVHPQLQSLGNNKPTCFISYAHGLGNETVDTLVPHLETAGINMLQDVEQADFIVVCGSKELVNAYNNPDFITPTKVQLEKVEQRAQNPNHNIFPIWFEGNDKTEVLPAFLWNESAIDFRKKEDYCLNCFSLLKQLYKLAQDDPYVEIIISEFKTPKSSLITQPFLTFIKSGTQLLEFQEAKKDTQIETYKNAKDEGKSIRKPSDFKWLTPGNLMAAGVVLLGITGGLIYKYWSPINSNNIDSLGTPCTLPVINGTCYTCPNDIPPLAYSNLLYLPNETCPETLNPELVSHAAEDDNEDYFDYITHLQNSTFANEQKSIIDRCLKGVTNASSAIARLDIRATAGRWFRKFWTTKDQSSWSFKLNIEQSKPLSPVSNRKICRYEVAYYNESRGSLTTTLDCPFRELGSLPPRAISREFQVNNYTEAGQSTPAIASLHDGGFVITWKGHDQAGGGCDIFGQRYDFLGNYVGEEFRINNYRSGYNHLNPSVAGLSDGGFVVTWFSNDQSPDRTPGEYDIFGQRYNRVGQPHGQAFSINSYRQGYQADVSTASLMDGGFVVTWVSYGTDGPRNIFGQLYNQEGEPLGGEFQVNHPMHGKQYDSSVTSLSNGDFVIVWQSMHQNGSTDMTGQLFDHIGNRLGGEFQVDSYIDDGRGETPSVDVSGLSDGNFVITWRSIDQQGDYDIFGRLYSHAGEPLGREFRINNYTAGYQSHPQVAGLNHGGFVVVWQSKDQDGSEYGVFGQRYANNGTRIGNEFQVNSYTSQAQYCPSVTRLNDGAFVVTWQSNGQDGSGAGIFARIFEY